MIYYNIESLINVTYVTYQLQSVALVFRESLKAFP